MTEIVENLKKGENLSFEESKSLFSKVLWKVNMMKHQL